MRVVPPAWIGVLVLGAALMAPAQEPAPESRAPIAIGVGSKKFTESVILGELIHHLAAAAGATVDHRRELGGTRVLYEALRSGEVVGRPRG